MTSKQQMKIEDIIAEYKRNPYQVFTISTPHTGIVSLKVTKGQKVQGTTGKWLERKGTLLYTLVRQGNEKRFYAPIDGEITDLDESLDGQFVEAKTPLMSIKHKLSKEEAINKVLEKFLEIYNAPETAKYYLAPELYQKIEQKGLKKALINPGEELLIMSRMKRDVVLNYEGRPGIIYVIYFKPNTTVNQGDPLLGICPPEQLEFISHLVKRIYLEWE